MQKFLFRQILVLGQSKYMQYKRNSGLSLPLYLILSFIYIFTERDSMIGFPHQVFTSDKSINILIQKGNCQRAFTYNSSCCGVVCLAVRVNCGQSGLWKGTQSRGLSQSQLWSPLMVIHDLLILISSPPLLSK